MRRTIVNVVLLLLTIAYGQRRLAGERRRSSHVRLNGHEVLLTENLGPAVAGIGHPVVFMPRWVLALDEASQRLLLEHELEHARRRDTTLLLGGAVTAAMLP
jgi:beta-lactamase regulating signal transducer with metallopeptidase domain